MEAALSVQEIVTPIKVRTQTKAELLEAIEHAKDIIRGQRDVMNDMRRINSGAVYALHLVRGWRWYRFIPTGIRYHIERGVNTTLANEG